MRAAADVEVHRFPFAADCDSAVIGCGVVAESGLRLMPKK
jgi:hypothetical protein